MEATNISFRARVRNGLDAGRAGGGEASSAPRGIRREFLEGLAALVESLEETNPEATTATFRVRCTAAGGLSASVETQPTTFAGHLLPIRVNTHAWTTDYPKAVQGTGQGPTPQEALLGALAADIASSFTLHAANQGVDVHAVRVEIHGDLDLRTLLDAGDRAPALRNVHARLFVQSREDRDELEHVKRLVERTSAVLGSLKSEVRLDLLVASID